MHLTYNFLVLRFHNEKKKSMKWLLIWKSSEINFAYEQIEIHILKLCMNNNFYFFIDDFYNYHKIVETTYMMKISRYTTNILIIKNFRFTNHFFRIEVKFVEMILRHRRHVLKWKNKVSWILILQMFTFWICEFVSIM